MSMAAARVLLYCIDAVLTDNRTAAMKAEIDTEFRSRPPQLILSADDFLDFLQN